MNNIDKKKMRVEADAVSYNIVIVVFAILAVAELIFKFTSGKSIASIYLLISASLIGSFGRLYITYKYDRSKKNLSYLIFLGLAAVLCLAFVIYERIILV